MLGELSLSEDLEEALLKNDYQLLRGTLTLLVTSITAALDSVDFAAVPSGMRVQILSRLIVGLKYWFLFMWK